MIAGARARYAALFATESRALLSTAAGALTALRGGDVATPAASIDAIFRAVHSLKGMAAAMEYASVERLAHELETVLGCVRDGGLAPTPLVTGMLATGLDELEVAVDAAVDGRAQHGDSGTVVEPLGTVPNRDGSAVDELARAAHVRVERERLDALLDVVGELTSARARLAAAATRTGDATVAAATADVSRLVGALQHEVRAVRTAPAAEVFERLPRVVRDAARALGKRAELVIEGGDVPLDRTVLEAMTEPLLHLLRNAVDHGLEAPVLRQRAGKPLTGRVVLRAARDRDAVLVSVTDDGAGIDRARVRTRAGAAGMAVPNGDLSDAALLDLIARPGFTTAAGLSAVSGRGVGVDAVRERLRRLGGALEMTTRAGEGTSFTMRLPLTVAIARALVARAGGETYALPIASVREVAEVSAAGATVSLRDEAIRAIHLADLVDAAAIDATAGPVEAAIVEAAGRRLALLVDAVDGEQEIVVKPLPAVRGTFRIFGGVTILADGTPALVVDGPALLQHTLA